MSEQLKNIIANWRKCISERENYTPRNAYTEGLNQGVLETYELCVEAVERYLDKSIKE